jgi:hypothetical protein
MSDMKIIMERWDEYLILENDKLEDVKNDPKAVTTMGKELQSADKEKLQNFLNIVSADSEIVDLVKSFKELSGLASQDIQEGILDDLGAMAYVKADAFFDTNLGKKIKTYGAPAAAIAFMAFQITQGIDIDPEMLKDVTEILIKGKNLSAADMIGMFTGAETGLAEQSN